MKVKWYCASCGKEGEVEIAANKPIPSIEEIVSGQSWIVQHNDPYTDIYCSKACAA